MEQPPGQGDDSSASSRQHAFDLMEKKESTQAALDTQFAILTANNATMNTPLVDAQGFPRADIDVYAVRHARVKIIELRNDLESIMDEIAQTLQGIYSPDSSNVPMPPSSNVVNGHVASATDIAALEPFARVDGVAPGSPAAEAGLRREDLIIKFGDLTATSFQDRSLQPLAELVNSSRNRPISVVVRRSGQDTRQLVLIPRTEWGGRGMLGCHLVPTPSG